MQLTTVAQAITQIPKVAGISIHTLFDPSTAEARFHMPRVQAGSDAGGASGYEDGTTIGGVYCGKEIGDDLLAEMLTERRYVIRQRIEPTYFVGWVKCVVVTSTGAANASRQPSPTVTT